MVFQLISLGVCWSWRRLGGVTRNHRHTHSPHHSFPIRSDHTHLMNIHEHAHHELFISQRVYVSSVFCRCEPCKTLAHELFICFLMNYSCAPCPLHQWYMLTVSYNYHRLKASELECYVNGQLVLSADVTMPSSEDVTHTHTRTHTHTHTHTHKRADKHAHTSPSL